jgi:hypothetical protein
MMKKTLLPAVMLIAAITLKAQHIPLPEALPCWNSLQTDRGTEVFLLDSTYTHLFPEDGGTTDSNLIQKHYAKYSEHGLVIADSSIGLFLDTTQWLYSQKREYTYDDLQRLTERTEYTGTMVSNIWLPKYRYINNYTGSTPMTDYELELLYYSQAWHKHDSTANTWDKLQQKEFAHRYIWDSDSGAYYIRNHSHYAYNAQGLVTGDTIFQYWSTGTPMFSYLRVYTWDDQGNRLTHTAFNWDDMALAWEEVEKHVSTYDGTGKLLTNFRYEWDYDAGQWENIDQGYFTYDEDNNMRLWMYWVKDELTGDWLKGHTMEFFWSLHTIVGIGEAVPGELFSVYPNPAAGRVTITSASGGNMDIYDMNGRLQFSFRAKPGTLSIDLSRLKPGLYLLCNENRSNCQRVVIR